MFKRAAIWFGVILSGVMLFACGGGGGQGLPSLTSFELRIDHGMFSHDLLIKSKVSQPMTSVDITITTTLEDGTKPQIKRFWEDWKYDEVKKINIPAGANLQTIDMSGTCYLPQTKAYVSSSWSGTKNKGEK